MYISFEWINQNDMSYISSVTDYILITFLHF